MDGNIRVSFFSHPMFLPKFLLKNLHLQILDLQMQVFEKKLWKEHGMRKEGNPDVTIQSSQLQVFEKKAMKGKVDEKSWNPRSTIQIHFH